MKHRILRINISPFVTLFGLIAGIDVQAYDRIELAGNVLGFALPIAAAGLALGFKDGQGTLEFGESAALAMGVTYALKFTIDKTRPNGEDQLLVSV